MSQLLQPGNPYLVKVFGAALDQQTPAAMVDCDRHLSINQTVPLMLSTHDQQCELCSPQSRVQSTA